MRKLVARYSGRCSLCSLPVSVGEEIAWAKGSKASHWDCHEKVLADIEDAYGTAAEAAKGVGEIDLGDPRHPENTEHVLALEETGELEELDRWWAAYGPGEHYDEPSCWPAEV